MKKFYARVKTQFETVTLVIKHKTVNTMETAKQRLIDEYKYAAEQIESITTTPPIYKNTYTNEVNSLFAYLDKLSQMRDGDVWGRLESL